MEKYEKIRDRINQLSEDQKQRLKNMMLEKNNRPKADGYYSESRHGKVTEIRDKELAGIRECSHLQKEFWYRRNLYREAALDNIAGYVKVKGHISADQIRRAFTELIGRHEVLRSKFIYEEGNIYVNISQEIKIDLAFTECPCGISEAELIEEMKKESKITFDLSAGNLIRMRCYHFINEWYLLMIQHHIISDGASTRILIREMLAGMGLIKKETQDYHENRFGYYDYVKYWQKRLSDGQYDGQLEYWRQELKDCDMSANLAESANKNEQDLFGSDRVVFRINEDIKSKAADFGKKHSISPFAFYMTVLRCLLYLHTKQEDTVIVIPIQGRNDQQIENLIGCFLNMLPIRNNINDESSFIACARSEYAKILSALENQDIPFGTIIKNLNIRNNNIDSSVYHIVFSYEGNALKNMDTGQYEVEFAELDLGNTKADLVLELNQEAEGLLGWFEYRTGKFSRTQIEFFKDAFLSLIDQILISGVQEVRMLSCLSEREKTMVLDYGTADVKDWEIQTINAMFTQMAERHPDKVALADPRYSLTYRELNERSNILARILKGQGVANEVIVGVIMQKSMAYFVTVLAILKAGGAFLPIEPSYPQERIQYVISDSGARYLVYDEYVDGFAFLDQLRIIRYGDLDLKTGDISNLPEQNKLSTLAYVIYTSGTTGNPKGVMVEHHGVSNLSQGFHHLYGVNEHDRVLQFSHIIFDACVWEMAISILLGGTLCIVTKEILLDVPELVRQVNKFAITVVDFSPQYWKQICKSGLQFRVLLTAGSEADEAVVKAAAASEIYVNGYGPTENTVCATLWNRRENDKIPSKIPIGKPMSNVLIYIVNEGGLCGLGMIGEICIAGLGLARGYLNRKKLTEEKFTDNPFGKGKIYHTGDYGRWMDNGDIEYIGRIDGQVKIRGYRVETGEIENCLCNLDVVAAAAVTVSQDTSGERTLDAYLVLNKEAANTINTDNEKTNGDISGRDITTKDITTKKVEEYLHSRLPFYMVPSKFYKVEAIPLTVNGKTDIRALKDMGEQLESGYEFVLPGNPAEEKLLEIWKELLKTDQIGVEDSFFESGGDSIIMLQVITRAKEEGIIIDMKSFYQDKNIVNIIKNATLTELFAENEAAAGTFRLFRAQSELLAGPLGWNHNNAVVQTDCPDSVEIEELTQIMRLIEKEQPILFSVIDFRSDPDKAVISEAGQRNNVIEITADRVSSPADVVNELNRIIDIQNGICLAAALVGEKKGKKVYLALNRLVCDRESAEILIKDLARRLTLENKDAQPVPAAYVTWQRAYRQYLASDESRYRQDKWREKTHELAWLQRTETEIAVRPEEVCDVSGPDWLSGKITRPLKEMYLDYYVTGQFGNYEISFKELVLAALVNTLTRQAGSRFWLAIKDNLRNCCTESVNTEQVVGNFSFTYPFLYRNSLDEYSHDRFLRDIKQHYYDISRIKDDYPGFLDNQAEPYVDLSDKEVVVLAFTEYDASAGWVDEGMSPGKISLCIAEEKVNVMFEWHFDRKRYDPETIKRLGEEFDKSLTELIEYCLTTNDKGITSSDFGNADLREEELAFILSKFNAVADNLTN